MLYCRKCNRKGRTFSRLAGPQTGLGRAPGRSNLMGVRPPNRPRPESWPGSSGGGPAPRPALAGLQAGGVGWVAGLQAGGPACSSLMIVGRPPGRPGPTSRPGTPYDQQLDFGRGYLYPSIYLGTTTTTKRRTPPLFESFKSIDLPL